MGWWSKIKKWVAIAVGAVLTIATLGLALPALIGTAVVEAGLALVGVSAATAASTASATIIGGATVASVVGGAITGAATGALTSAIAGTDPLKGALGGFVAGAVGPLASGAASSLLGSTGLPSIATNALSRGVGGFGAGTAGGFAAGMSPSQALRAGALSGGAGLISGLGQEAFGLDKSTTSALQTAARTGLGALFPSSTKQVARTPSSATPTTTQGTGRTFAPSLATSVTQSRASPALASALSIGPSVSYIGAPVFGSGDTSKGRRKVWNTASLRNVGE